MIAGCAAHTSYGVIDFRKCLKQVAENAGLVDSGELAISDFWSSTQINTGFIGYGAQ